MINTIRDTLTGDFFPTSQFRINEKKKLDFEHPKIIELDKLLTGIRNELKELVGSDYDVTSSVGQYPLNLAWSPWIGIHSNRGDFDSKSKSGIYLTILWCVDGSGVCVSLQTGVDYSGVNEIKPRARGIRLNYGINRFSEDIDLASSFVGKDSKDRPWQYEQANIEGKNYNKDSINEITNDLNLFLEDYESLIERKLLRKAIREEIAVEEIQQAKLPEKSNPITGTKWKTSKTIRNKALDRAGRKCEFNPDHLTFKDSNKNTFMEGHHLVPMEYQDLFAQSLDIVENIVSLCPICHREIHHALPNRRKEMALYLFELRKEELTKILPIEQNQLISFYEDNLDS